MHERAGEESVGVLGSIGHELRHHAPFTFVGALTGIADALVFLYANGPQKVSHGLFAVFHPGHVFLSAVARAGMFRLHGGRGVIATILVGYVGAVGIATLSDSIIPYLSELLLQVQDEHIHPRVHLGFIEEWYLVNPLALLGIAVAWWRPTTEIPHAGHVLLSTWASLFHILMSIEHGADVSTTTFILIPVVLFFAVWAPCCTSDVVFPLLFARGRHRPPREKARTP